MKYYKKTMSNSGLFYVSGARRLQERRFNTVYVGAVHAPVVWWATFFAGCGMKHRRHRRI